MWWVMKDKSSTPEIGQSGADLPRDDATVESDSSSESDTSKLNEMDEIDSVLDPTPPSDTELIDVDTKFETLEDHVITLTRKVREMDARLTEVINGGFALSIMLFSLVVLGRY